ncbi:urea ABC transporter ATP-binding subunit UrtE [Sulfurirhabdus autotrophica]|uniref:Amino acid/amide ABC transporter ATP-binding protein 2 (HAAT family) n=1 Tax=Sulfurirhabdus autotrophica TaxID=1706046 RepID=A0A4R3Y3U3_9PROT|nr:urea ABC transporter ATP-binding subunit UrtE [Sulfurirhabdus autotrophica]TCV85418.1 amino acid/amide ABC transporter ATP-binding protein 2 (HAAT family) [Sulfurirhabdus autotrophica]
MLNVSGINQYYGGSHTLRDVGLHVEKGAVTCLLGRNGVGKSTLLKCLMGVLPVKSGSVELEGKNITSLSPHERAKSGMAYVPQGREIFPRLTVEENLRMGLAGLKGKDSKTIPAEIFDMFPVLKEMMHRRGGDLSGGQQQQLAIGRALAMRPKLLILDEPTEGIQPSIIKDIERVIQSLAKRGDMGILLVEQYYDFAHTLADYYVVMQRGEVIKSGPGSEMEAENVQGLLAV